MAEYSHEGIAEANRQRAALILVTIDTPGGIDTAMRDIIQHIIDSKTPVVVYVMLGLRAASAGFFILAVRRHRGHGRLDSTPALHRRFWPSVVIR